MQTLMAGPGLPGVFHQRVSWPPLASTRLAGRCRLPRHAPSTRLLPPLASTVKEERKTTGGRQAEGRSTGSGRSTSGGGTGRTTSGRKDGGSPAGSTSTRPQQPAQPPTQRPPAPPTPTPPKRRPDLARKSVSSASRLDLYMRKHPFYSRFYDTTLLLGDCVMILATEASSERIEWSSFPALVGVLLACWVTAGAINGDYSPSGSRAHDDVPWQLSMLGPTFGSVMGAALTWAFSAPAAAAAYAVLVARNALDPGPVVDGLNTDDLSPQLEVVVALLITMTCWRGIVSKLRPNLPGDS